MTDSSGIREHMEVIGSDGAHVGTVDHMEGDRIKLTKSDPGSGGRHHYIRLEDVAAVDGDKVRLSTLAARAKQTWETDVT
jgi:hypothetical protein